MVLAYRNDEDVLQARLGSLLDNRSAEVAAISSELRVVYARRVARAVAGGVASIGGLALFVGGAARWAASSVWNHPYDANDGTLTAILGGSVLATALAYAPAHLLAARAFDRSLSRVLSLSGNVRIDLVRVERARPRRIASDLIARNEAASAGLPLVAAALVVPLALHFLVWLLLASAAAMPRLGAFDEWIALSAPLAGLAHFTLAFLGAQLGVRLPARSTAALRIKPAQEGWYAFGATAVAGLIPGALLFLIPPLIVAATGVVFIPLSFYRMNRAIVRERELVDSLAA